MRRVDVLFLPAIFAAVMLAAVSSAPASDAIAEQTGLKCTRCHDKPGSKLLTDRGKYFETQRTLEGYDQLAASFGACTRCHVRRPGSKKLTRTGKRLSAVIHDMDELRQWLEERHPPLSSKYAEEEPAHP